jgi:hypothetical protein
MAIASALAALTAMSNARDGKTTRAKISSITASSPFFEPKAAFAAGYFVQHYYANQAGPDSINSLVIERF